MVEKVKGVVEKGILATLGFWLLVHEKADEVIRELIEKGKVAPEEGRHFLEELSKRVDEEKEEIKAKIAAGTKKVVKEAGGATKEDIEKIMIKLDELEGRISRLEEKKSSGRKK